MLAADVWSSVQTAVLFHLGLSGEGKGFEGVHLEKCHSCEVPEAPLPALNLGTQRNVTSIVKLSSPSIFMRAGSQRLGVVQLTFAGRVWV